MTKVSDLPGDITGIVTDAVTSEPLDSVSIKIDPSTNNNNNVLSASDGTYLIKNIGPGSHEITASKSRYIKVSKEIEVKPGETTENDFALDSAEYREISVMYLDFGLESNIRSFTIKNAGKGTLNYTCQSTLNWIEFEHTGGRVSTETDTIHVMIDRSAISEETRKEFITIVSFSGEEEIRDTILIYVNGVMGKEEEKYYRVVRIRDQIWMAENLNTGKIVNIPSGIYGGNLSDIVSDNEEIEKFCWENNPDYCDKRGGLYWPAEAYQYQNDSIVQGICPDGWHLPSESEWIELFDNYGGIGKAAPALRDTGTIEAGTGLWPASDIVATNESELSIIPHGTYYASYGWIYKEEAFPLSGNGFWEIINFNLEVWRSCCSNIGSVRCIKDP